MRTTINKGSVVVFVSLLTTIIGIATSDAQGAVSPRPASLTSIKQPAAAINSACGRCVANRPSKAGKRNTSKGARADGYTPCHPKGYIDPKVARKYNAAIREMKREGIKPQVTSAWRSSAHQASLHKCSRSSRCRKAHPGLYFAKPAGQSLHEAGFAVDISGVAAGPRGGKRLTPRGRRIVGIMQKNGFKWRYGLADPAHFEADPRKNGYRSVKAAIHKSQTQCSVKIIAGKQKKSAGKSDVRPATRLSSAKRASAHNSPAKSRSQRG